MNCEKCKGPMWDNTVDKKNPKGPDYKCKDKACGHAVWLDKKKSNGAPTKQTSGAKWTWSQLSVTYRRSLLIAKQHVPKLLPDASPSDVVAAAATLFIAASRDGVSEPAKEEPAPAVQPLHEKPKEFTEPDDSDIPF